MTTPAPTPTTAAAEMRAIGLGFPRWQDAVEAAMATDRLSVAGEVRGGQLVQFSDASGAQINILAVEPYATFIGFAGVTQNFAHVTMVSDVLGLVEIIDPYGTPIATVAANIAQGPLLADEDTQQWQQINCSALAVSATSYPSAQAYEESTGQFPSQLSSSGAEIILSGNGSTMPTAAVEFSGRVMEASWRTTDLTGQRFQHIVLDGAFPFDVCIADDGQPLAQVNSVIAGTALLSAAVQLPQGGCGSGAGGCGCGSGGCGGH